MEIKSATEEQIAIFKQAVADRYTERGVPAEKANSLFATAMDKLAADLGVGTEKKSDKVEKIASSIAASVGRTRKI